MPRPEGTKKELEERRKRAVLLVELGVSVRQVAELKDVTRQSVYRWKNMYEEAGMDGLAATPNSGGREPKVSEDTLPDLYPILLERNEECSNEESLTLSRIAEIIEEEFDVSVSISSVQRYLEKADVSEQRLEQCVRKCDSENE